MSEPITDEEPVKLMKVHLQVGNLIVDWYVPEQISKKIVQLIVCEIQNAHATFAIDPGFPKDWMPPGLGNPHLERSLATD